MSVKAIRKLLEKALLQDGEMAYPLYEYELEEMKDYLINSLKQDKDEFIFAVTENSGHVAMVLIDISEEVFINESALTQLKSAWPKTYRINLKRLIPSFAKQLHAGEIPINGVKTVGHT